MISEFDPLHPLQMIFAIQAAGDIEDGEQVFVLRVWEGWFSAQPSEASMRLLAARGAWAAQYNTNDRAEAERVLFARARTVDEWGSM